MARAVLSLDAFPGLTFDDLDEGRDVFAEDGPAQERTLRAGGVAPRRYTWVLKGYPETAEAQRLWVAARALNGEAFYVLDPWDLGQRVSLSLGESTAGQTVVSLPTDDRDHPIAAGLVLTADAAPVTVASVDTDGRRILLAAPLDAGKALVASYTYYRLCRFEGMPTWTAEAGDWYAGRVVIREILREP